MRGRGGLRRLAVLVGPGLISAVAGLEITNIEVFTYAGSKYGFAILWAIILSMLITAFMQQLAAEVGVESRRGLVVLVGGLYGFRVLAVFIASLVASNIATASLNIAGAGMALEALTGTPWPLCSIAVAAVSLALASTRSYKRVEKILTIMAFTLSVYIVLAVYYLARSPESLLEVIWGSLVPSWSFERDFMVDFLSIFGAAAAAYSLVFQAAGVVYEKVGFKELPEEFMNIMVGVVLTTLASVSITVVAAAHLYTQGVVVSTVHEAIMALEAIGPLALTLFTVGSVSSALLAIEAIVLCNSYLIHEYRTGETELDGAVVGRGYTVSTLLTILGSLGIALGYGYFLGFESSAFVEMGKWFSVIISLTSWLPAVVIAALYWRVTILSSSFLRLMGGFLAAALVAVNVVGVIGILRP